MKTTLSLQHLTQSALYAVTSAAVIVTLLFATFLLAEPQITRGQTEVDNATFFIRQTITDETSFDVPPPNVTMQDTGINGITGGNATGTTQFVVVSNNADGYYVNIRFFDNGTGEAMQGDADDGSEITDYAGDVGGEPSYNFITTGAAQFAYTVMSSTTSNIDQSFQHNGTNECNTGSNTTPGFCWKSPAVADFRIINRTIAAVDGATSSIQFKVSVPAGATPTPTAQTYTATATLTLFINS